MPFLYKCISHGREIILEFDDEWEKNSHYSDKATRENFINAVFAEIISNHVGKNDYYCHFVLVQMKQEKSISQLIWFNKKFPETLYTIYVANPPSAHEFKTAITPQPKSVFSNIERKKILPELGLDEKSYLTWKEQSDSLIAQYQQFQQRFDVTLRAMTKHQKSKRLKNADMLKFDINAKHLKVHLGMAADVIHAAEFLHTMLLESYREYIDKLKALLELKQRLILIVQTTALEYAQTITPLDDKEFKLAAEYFNQIFSEFAQINEKEKRVESKPINFSKMMLCDIAKIFNRLFLILNTFYNRWLDSSLNPLGRSEPITTLVNKLNGFIQEHKPIGSAPLSYNNFVVTFNQQSLDFERDISYQLISIQISVENVFKSTLEIQNNTIARMLRDCTEPLAEVEQTSLLMTDPADRIVAEVVEDLVRKVSLRF